MTASVNLVEDANVSRFSEGTTKKTKPGLGKSCGLSDL